jgi:hypothetical protein
MCLASRARLWHRRRAVAHATRTTFDLKMHRVAVAVRGATLVDRIPVVIQRCSNEQMRWIDAPAIVAMVTDHEAETYGSDGQLVRHAVRVPLSVAAAAHTEISVAVPRALSEPLPAVP